MSPLGSKTAFAPSSSSISNTRSTTATCRTCSAWWRTCWMKTSGTSAPSDAGAASSARHRHSISAPTRWSSVTRLWAEMTCFMVLGWRFPVHVFDLHTAYLATSNILLPYDPDEVRKKPRKRLSDACRAYGIEGWENIDKPDDCQGDRRRPLARIRPRGGAQYCEEDVRNSAELLRRQTHAATAIALPSIPQLVMRWSELQRQAVARIQARGMPIDMPLWNLVQENKPAVIGALIARFDPSQGSDDPIYSPDGEWSSWPVRALAGQLPVSRNGRDWIPVRSSSTATLSHDVRRTPGDRGASCAARRPWRHCARPDPDRSRRSQPSEPVSVWHRHRPQCAGQKPVQRARQHALVHEVSGRQDRALSGLANPGSRDCRGAQR